jgi:hypothetical protein
VQVFTLLASTPQEVLRKDKFQSFFDGIFISNRSAQFSAEPLANSILRSQTLPSSTPKKCLVAVETAKYCVPLLRNQRKEFQVKLKEFGLSQGWTHCLTRK